jgi:hypothetical protein
MLIISLTNLIGHGLSMENRNPVARHLTIEIPIDYEHYYTHHKHFIFSFEIDIQIK